MRTSLILLFPGIILLLVAISTWRQPKKIPLAKPSPVQPTSKRHQKAPKVFKAVWSHLSPAYQTNPKEYFSEDCVTAYLRKKLSIVIMLDDYPSDEALPILNTTLHSLLLSLDLRTCSRLLLTRADMLESWQSTITTAAQSDPLFHSIRLMGTNSADDDALPSVLQLKTEMTLVLPVNYPLDVELRLYYFMNALAAQSKVVLKTLHSLMIPLEEVQPKLQTHSFLLSSKYFPGKAIQLELPLMSKKGTVPSQLQWIAATQRGKHYSDKHRNECLMELLCRDHRTTFWMCDAISPLLRYDHKAYMQMDCMSQYIKDHLTVLVTAHVTPSNPNPFLLRLFLQSLHLMPEIRHARKIIVYDGVPANKTDRLRQTIANVNKLLNQDSPVVYNTVVMQLPEQGKLRKTTEFGVHQLKTPYVMVAQPDLPFLRPPHLYYLLRSMEADDQLAYVRFSRSPNHQSKFDYWLSNNVPPHSWVPLCRTPVFSSENHLVPVSLYTKVIFPTVEEGKFTRWGLSHCRTVECLMNKRSNKTPLFGTFIYGHIGDGPFAVHLDGSERHQKIPPELLQQL